MGNFVGRDLRFMFERQADIIQAMQQAMSPKRLDFKSRTKPALIENLVVLKIDRQLIALARSMPSK